jgi:hypothetical protein
MGEPKPKLAERGKFMSLTTCPQCAAPIADQATACPKCGAAIETTQSRNQAPIHHMGGKLQAIGIVVLAGAIISTLAGAWWGPALLFPGIVVFVMGRFY